MTPKFLHNQLEISAGQALDVWLAATSGDDAQIMFPTDRYHCFADAAEGYPSAAAALRCVGIEIKFGDES